MYADWGEAARQDIAEVAKGFGPETPLKERQRALRAHAHDFHGGTSWGKKVWSRECRKYLEQHGLPPIPARGVKLSPRQMEMARRHGTQHAKIAAPDITFPYRKEG